MQEPVRKPWSTPCLTVLARSAPEETVLRLCKVASFGGPEAANNACYSANCMQNCKGQTGTS